uniref:BRINP EGF domain-containing protein n=1 Tax=Knipowitschia caucasica TaxID=637954 RepID=A0AAV2KXU8_KNICA
MNEAQSHKWPYFSGARSNEEDKRMERAERQRDVARSPENKVQLQGLQMILPDYLQESFVQAALSYIACNGEGDFMCKDNDCWCHCEPQFPECNCPYMDIQAMEESLQRITQTWGLMYKEFEESELELFVAVSSRQQVLPRAQNIHQDPS